MTDTQGKPCPNGCGGECKAELHGCASECPLPRATTEKSSAVQAVTTDVSALRAIVEFAYEQGFHELGYDPVSELISAAQTVPEGFALVPIKATPEIRDALRLGSRKDCPSDEMCNVRWAAAIAARPQSKGDV